VTCVELDGNVVLSFPRKLGLARDVGSVKL
jgi:hypothetical protein